MRTLRGDTQQDARDRYSKGGFGGGARALKRLNQYLRWLSEETGRGGGRVSVLHDAVAKAVAELEAEHRPDLTIAPMGTGKVGGCVMCWPKDGSWPCVSRMVADDLRKLAGGGR